MKFGGVVSELVNLIENVAVVIEEKPLKPFMQGVLLLAHEQRVTVQAFSGFMSGSAVSERFKVQEPGRACVRCSHFMAALKRHGQSQFMLVADEAQAELSVAGCTYKMALLEAQDFPSDLA